MQWQKQHGLFGVNFGKKGKIFQTEANTENLYEKFISHTLQLYLTGDNIGATEATRQFLWENTVVTRGTYGQCQLTYGTLVNNFATQDWRMNIGFYFKKQSLCTFINDIHKDAKVSEYYKHELSVSWRDIRAFEERNPGMEDILNFETYINDILRAGFSSYCDICSPTGVDPVASITTYKLLNLPESFAISLENSESMLEDSVGELTDLTTEKPYTITPSADKSKYHGKKNRDPSECFFFPHLLKIAAEHSPTGTEAQYVLSGRIIAVTRLGGHYYTLVYHEPLPGISGVFKVDNMANIPESKGLLVASDRKELADVTQNTLMVFYERLHDLQM